MVRDSFLIGIITRMKNILDTSVLLCHFLRGDFFGGGVLKQQKQQGREGQRQHCGTQVLKWYPNLIISITRVHKTRVNRIRGG